MSDTSDQSVDCSTHGRTGPAILCRHLCDAGTEGDPAGWVQAAYDRENREPGDLMAWCHACDRAYERFGGWNEDSEPEAAFRVVCSACFEAIGQVHAIP